MGNTCKRSTISVDNAKLETAVGSCGLGACRSSCCEDPEQPLDAPHKNMEIATRVELALAHKIVTEEMITCLKLNGELPRLNVVREDADSSGKRTITITVRMTGDCKKESG